MKKLSPSFALFVCTLAAAISIVSLSNARAGAPLNDDIIIFRSTQSDRSTNWFQTEGDTPIGKTRRSYRERGYLILNLTTGEYREVSYRTGSVRDQDGKRVKSYEASDSDLQAQAMFQTGPDDRRNYLILSLIGSGMGENFTFVDPGAAMFTRVRFETLEGLMKVQKIRTDSGVVECIAPSTVRGNTGEESHNILREINGDEPCRVFETGRRSLRIDKRLIAEAKNAGADSLETFQSVVTNYLESRGYGTKGM